MIKEKSKKLPPNVEIFNVTGVFFIAGMFFYVIAMVAGLFAIPGLVEAQPVRSAAGWSLAHLFVLGFATMISMGASYQLIQVILRTSIYSKRLAFVHFYFALFGVGVLVFSFFTGFLPGLALGGSLFAIGVLLYTGNILMTMYQKREWNPYVFGTLASLVNLLATVGTGLLMGIVLGFGGLPFSYQDLFHSHLWLGLAGWLAGLVITYTFKLLPMFYNSSRKAVREAYVILSFWQLGVWLEVFVSWVGWGVFRAAAWLFMLVSLVLLVRFSRQVAVQGRKKDPGGAVSIARHLLTGLLMLAFIWLFVPLFFVDSRNVLLLTEAIVAFLILGWFPAVILSYLSKIVPFLWWAYRFQTSWEKKSRVLLSAMTRDKRLKGILYGYLAGSVLVASSFLAELPILGMVGHVTAIAAAFLYITELARVLRY